jgi:hypothetical protein
MVGCWIQLAYCATYHLCSLFIENGNAVRSSHISNFTRVNYSRQPSTRKDCGAVLSNHNSILLEILMFLMRHIAFRPVSTKKNQKKCPKLNLRGTSAPTPRWRRAKGSAPLVSASLVSKIHILI